MVSVFPKVVDVTDKYKLVFTTKIKLTRTIKQNPVTEEFYEHKLLEKMCRKDSD